MWDESRDDVKSSRLLWIGPHMCYIDRDKKKQRCESEQIYKICLSSDCSLKFENMKQESLVIVDKNATVNMLANLVHTARHVTKIRYSVMYI